MMGIYYAAPLLGPSMGPLAGGILTQLFNWRATFWFLVIFGVLSMASFVTFKDTFRRERSLAYQAALQRIREQTAKAEKNRKEKKEISSTLESQTQTIVEGSDTPSDEKRGEERTAPRSPIPASLVEAGCKISVAHDVKLQDVKLSLRDINPVTPVILILRRRNNLATLIASGIAPLIKSLMLINCTFTRLFLRF